jgi:restriction system protein
MTENFENLHDIEKSEEYTKSYEVRYIAEIKHLGLGTYRIIKDKDTWILDNKIDAQFKKWDDQWSKIVSKNQIQATKESNQNLADERTRDAQEKLKQIEDILLYTLDIDDTIDWNVLKDVKKFRTPNPKNSLDKELAKVLTPETPSYKEIPVEPNIDNFKPKISFIDKLIKSRQQNKINKSIIAHRDATNTWKELVKQTDDYNSSLDEKYNFLLQETEKQKEEIIKVYDLLEQDWEKAKTEYINKQNDHNQKIDKLKEAYFQNESTAVIQYCEMVLNNSEYSESFPKDFELEYNSDNRLLIIEYVLPEPDDFPKLLEVKYIATKKELKEIFVSDTQFSKLYDNAIYNICLRTLHEIFESDKSNAIDMVAFNGWVDTINKASGKKTNSCIVSVQAKKVDFIQIQLAKVDAKACFKSLKGIGSSKLSGIIAVQPLIQINKNDKRFIPSYDVANTLNEG